ncbi:MAG: hypothetical protein JWM40_2940 [Frankiales bacterium]|nr:hypothetical protein [Frankiales bacterium]
MTADGANTPTGNPHLDWEGLGAAVLHHRKRRKQTRDQLAAQAGISGRTLGTLERGGAISEVNANAVGRALRWPRGMIESLLLQKFAWAPGMDLSQMSELPEEAAGPEEQHTRELRGEWFERKLAEDVGPDGDDAAFVADRGPDDRSPGISNDEVVALIKRQRAELDELLEKLGERPVDGAG